MSFTYKIFVSPAAYENLYAEMRSRGHTSVKETIRDLMLTADDEDIERALRLAKQREAMRGSNSV